jgi:hypothetical protein
MCLGLLTDDTIMSGKMRSDYGLAMTIIILINIVANFLIFLYSAFSSIKKKVIECLCKKMKTKPECMPLQATDANVNAKKEDQPFEQPINKISLREMLPSEVLNNQ